VKRQSSHTRFRELIAARLDGPLTRNELRSLSSHLKTCAQCRQVDREYREQRERLHSLPSPIPPRDLWARTSSALDREVARGSYRRPGYRRVFGRRHSSTPVAALVTSIAAIGLASAMIVLQFGPSLQRAPTTEAGRPTPIAVSPQSLAFVGAGADDIALYQASVSQVCPTSTPDCTIDEGIERTNVQLPANVKPRNVALSPSGNQLALVGREADEDVIAIVTMPRGAGSGTGDKPRSPRPDNGTQEPEVTVDPLSSGAPDQPVTDAPDVVAILEDAQSAGAPPAWSPNSETLAFSAMPADGSHGPDVYVWSVGDDHARAVTDDHSSFFASWSGRRIVVSRLVDNDKSSATIETAVIDPDTLEERTVDVAPIWLPTVNPGRTHALVWYGDLALAGGLPEPRVGALYVMDWAQVDPFAEGAPTPTPEPTDEPTPEPTDEPTPPPTEEPTPPPSDEPTPPPSDEPSSEPTDEPSPDASGTVNGSRSIASGRTVTTPRPEPNEGSSSTSNAQPTRAPVAAHDPAVAPDGFLAIDADRDPLAEPVIDWQAMWSTDGSIVGVWVADVPGSTWGRLVVHALDQQERVGLIEDAVVSATLAQRGFTLGLNRVAWVAPTDGDPDGELRVRTWGSDGEGGLRLRPADVNEVVPAF
jgi:hypothetical protein